MDDTPFVLDDQATVRLAHSTSLTPEQRRAWWAHLDDHQVVGLFDQLGTDPVDITDPDADELTGLRGHTIDDGQLGRQARARGWQYDQTVRFQDRQRGQNSDGPIIVREIWDDTRRGWTPASEPVQQNYGKTCWTVQITAQIRFTTLPVRDTMTPSIYPVDSPMHDLRPQGTGVSRSCHPGDKVRCRAARPPGATFRMA